jgi:hypothetical protein
MNQTVKKVEEFLNGTPKLIFYAYFSSLFVISFFYHAYSYTRLTIFYWPIQWPKPLLDMLFHTPINLGIDLGNEGAAVAICYVIYSCTLLILLL